MDARERILTFHLRMHDSELFCQRQGVAGIYHVFRRAVVWDSFAWEGGVLLYSRPSQNLCFSLTDNWSPRGRSVDWGIEPVVHRARETHFARAAEVLREIEAFEEREAAAKDRDFANHTESFLKEHRREFALAFNDVNTSTLPKFDLRRKKENGLIK